MKNFLIFFFIFISLFSFSQKAERLPLRKYKIATLSDSLRETSGLTFLQEKLYTFNDGGNTNEIFELDKNSGKILKKIKTNFLNKDWEAITNDGENLYVADFGNNYGTRNDLAIYKLDSIFKKNNTSFRLVETKFSKKIYFKYAEQKDFSAKPHFHDFDAEAMVFINGIIHVFSKEWFSNKTSHYVINSPNSKEESQNIRKLEDFNTKFVVTDASYFEAKLYVVGYTKKAKVFMMIFEEDKNGLFFNKTAKKYKLGSALTVGQVEGIAVNKYGIYISNESFSKFIFKPKPSLYFVAFEKLKQ